MSCHRTSYIVMAQAWDELPPHFLGGRGGGKKPPCSSHGLGQPFSRGKGWCRPLGVADPTRHGSRVFPIVWGLFIGSKKRWGSASPGLSARFVSDANLPGSAVVLRDQRFTKTWRLRNDGALAWPSAFSFKYFGACRQRTPRGTCLIRRCLKARIVETFSMLPSDPP